MNFNKKNLFSLAFTLFFGLFLVQSNLSNAALSGTYSINPSASASASNYQTITSFLTDLKFGYRADGGTANGPGVGGAVTANISDGTYTGAFRIGNIAGASSTNKITIKSASGDSSKVIITNPSSTLTTNNYTLMIDSCDFVKIHQVTLERTGTNTYGTVLRVSGGACDNTISNCIIKGGMITSSTNNYTLIFQQATLSALRNHRNTYQNNYLKGGSYGAYLYGSSRTIPDKYTKFIDNTLDSVYQYCMYNYYQKHLHIDGNKYINMRANGYGSYGWYNDSVTFTNNTVNSNYAYAYYGYYSNNATISKNQIYGGTASTGGFVMYYNDSQVFVENNIIQQPNSGTYGIYINNSDAMGTSRGKVFNNMIYQAGTTAAYGLNIYNSTGFDIAYNSVNMQSSSTTSRAFYGYATLSAVYNNRVLNNIFYASTGYAVDFSANVLTLNAFSRFNFNDIYSGGINLSRVGTVDYTNLSAWQTATSCDSNSISINPQYKSNTDLHISKNTVNGLATPLAFITKDYDGDNRSSTTPDMGADEYDPLNNDVKLLSLLSPKNNDCGDSNTTITAIILNDGINSQQNIPLSAIITGSLNTTLLDTLKTTLATNAQDTLRFRTRINTFAGGVYTIKIFTSLSNDQDRGNDTLNFTINLKATPTRPTSVTGASRCGYGSVNLIAGTPQSGFSNVWYASQTSQNPIHTGDTLTTPNIGATTTYFVAQQNTKSGYFGALNTSFGAVSNYNFLTDGQVIRAYNDVTLDSCTVYPNANGNVIVRLLDSTGTFLTSVTIPVSPSVAGAPIRIPVGFQLKANTVYRIDASGSTTGGLLRNTAGAVYPYRFGNEVSITRPINSLAGFYYFFYNWRVSTPGCVSPRVPVTATINSGTKPTVKFKYSVACLSTNVSFTDSSIAPSGTTISNYYYQFGDGSSYSSATNGNPSHTYSTDGVYKVVLAVTLNNGCTDTFSKTIFIEPNPKADFFVFNTCHNANAIFQNTGTNNIFLSNITYYFGDSTTNSSNQSMITKSFRYPSTFQVKQVIVTKNGCRDSITKAVVINQSPNAPTVTSAITCNGSASLNLSASAPTISGGVNKWYASATSDTVLQIGNTYTTPILSSSKTYYVETTNFAEDKVGPASNTAIGTAGGANTLWGLRFDAHKDITLDSVTVYADDSGFVIITINDSFGTLYSIDSIKIAHSSVGTFLSFRIPVFRQIKKGNDYTITGILYSTRTAALRGLYRNTSGANYPFVGTNGLATITGHTFQTTTSNTYYYYLYNWKVSTPGCTSPRVPVLAVIGTGPKPTANFSSTATCAKNKITITDNSTIGSGGTLVSWKYDFSDTTTQTLTSNGNTSKIFQYPRRHKIMLTVTANGGCVDTISRFVDITPNIVAKIGNVYGCEKTGINFINNSSSGGGNQFKWYFGTGDSSTLASPPYYYQNAGNYNLRLVARNSQGCTDTAKLSFEVHRRPIADFGVKGVCLGDTTLLTDNSSIQNGKITSRLWDFGASQTDTAKSVNKLYTTPQSNLVKLIVTTDKGCMDTISKMVTLNNLPKPKFSIAATGLKIDFSPNDTDAKTYDWQYGDGNNSQLKFPTYTYSVANQYKVSLTITDKNGCMGSYDSLITIQSTQIENTNLGGNKLSIFPNPTKAKAYIVVESKEQSNISIQILTLQGKLVSDIKQGMLNQGTHQFTWDTETIKAGMYLVKVIINGKQSTSKISVLK